MEYAIYEKGLFVGILELTPEEVRAMTADAVYVVRPLHELANCRINKTVIL